MSHLQKITSLGFFLVSSRVKVLELEDSESTEASGSAVTPPPPSLVTVGESIRERSTAAELHRRLIRNRRNISWYKQHSDFWNWYKYFTDNGNQEAVSLRTRPHLQVLNCAVKTQKREGELNLDSSDSFTVFKRAVLVAEASPW